MNRFFKEPLPPYRALERAGQIFFAAIVALGLIGAIVVLLFFIVADVGLA